jgi:hypothetical protein
VLDYQVYAFLDGVDFFGTHPSNFVALAAASFDQKGEYSKSIFLV